MGKIQLTKVRKSFGEVDVIPGIDLTIENGEFVVFVGPSGCGKSTLLRLIAGLEDTTSGVIDIDGKDATALPPAKRGLAMVFQSYALYPHMTVRKNIAFPLKMAGMPEAEQNARIERAAKVLNLSNYLDRRPGQLSGGQRQRVAIARAIARKPKVLLFDEPLSNLDAALRQETRVEIARLHKALKATILYVTHDQVEAMTLADRIVLMNNGRIEQAGPPIALYDRPETLFVARFLGTPGINLFGAARLGFPEAATVGIRPEHLRVEALPQKDSIPARIELIEELGDIRLIHLVTEAEEKIVAKLPAKTPHREGESVHVAWAREHLHLFDLKGRRIDPASLRRPERAA